MLSNNRFLECLAKAPENKWTEIYKNIYALKIKKAVATISPNVSSFNVVSEWQSQCYRLDLDNTIRIDGLYFVGPDLSEIKNKLEREMNFLNRFIIPKREE